MKVYEKGCELLEEELDLISILQQIQKLKALVSVLTREDTKVINEARSIYVKKQLIDLAEEEDNTQRDDHNPKFFDFLNEDEYESLMPPMSALPPPSHEMQ